MLKLSRIAPIALGLALLTTGATAETPATVPAIGVRAGIGTDVSLGLAYGLGVNYRIPVPSNALEIGIMLFGGSYNEETDNGFNRYEENTDLFVFALMANYLLNYVPGQDRPYFITGFGLGSVNMTWEERSTTDPSLGTPLPGGGSFQEDDGSGGGTIFNFGIGYTFSSGLDLRAETPIIISFAAPGEASAVVPALTVTAGYRF